MKKHRNRAVEKERPNKNVMLNVVTNCALAFLIFSVGVVCLFPVDSAVTTDGGESNVYRCAPGESDGVSLMFNVYWGTDEVYRILDTLDAHEGKATFFIGGSWADDNVACVKEILSRGHELGNHGYFHKDHSAMTEEENREEISVCNRFIHLMTGVHMTLFAPPSGAYGKAALSACAALNMKTILWSRDTIDWRDKDSSLIYSRATKNIKGGEFVLMHPMKETADALDDILTYYETCALRAVTVSENLQAGG